MELVENCVTPFTSLLTYLLLAVTERERHGKFRAIFRRAGSRLRPRTTPVDTAGRGGPGDGDVGAVHLLGGRTSDQSRRSTGTPTG